MGPAALSPLPASDRHVRPGPSLFVHLAVPPATRAGAGRVAAGRASCSSPVQPNPVLPPALGTAGSSGARCDRQAHAHWEPEVRPVGALGREPEAARLVPRYA